MRLQNVTYSSSFQCNTNKSYVSVHAGAHQSPFISVSASKTVDRFVVSETYLHRSKRKDVWTQHPITHHVQKRLFDWCPHPLHYKEALSCSSLLQKSASLKKKKNTSEVSKWKICSVLLCFYFFYFLKQMCADLGRKKKCLAGEFTKGPLWTFLTLLKNRTVIFYSTQLSL